MWLAILGVSVLLLLLLQDVFGAAICACAAGVYLVDVRPKILEIQGSRADPCDPSSPPRWRPSASSRPRHRLPAATADPVPAPPYVDHVEWAKWGDLSSLRVYPTPSARQAASGAGRTNGWRWAEVLALSPDAAIPGMREQFICHWQFAESAEPGKVSWNLEPWRPEVTGEEMVAAGCNPGGTLEPF